MGTSCNLCMHDSTAQTFELEIEGIEKKVGNRDIMNSIILIQRCWRGYLSRQKPKLIRNTTDTS